ncbi:MAG TPA: hypothetical protein GXX15_04965 [Clostridia bacterium]|nr:hypothetical protein [Clostridia bacterium]
MVISIKFLTEKGREQIGFNYVIAKLQVITPYGKEELKSIEPFKREEKGKLLKEYEYIESMKKSLEKDKELFYKILKILFKIKDIRNSIKRCKNGEILDEVELYEIKLFCLLSEELRTMVERLKLDIKDIKLKSTESILDLLDPQRKRISAFHIYDDYSERLKELRKKKREIERQIFLETQKEKIEELKEKRLGVVILEQQEELEIKEKLSKELLGYADTLEKNIKAIGRFDFLMAKAKLAAEYGGVKPNINDDIKIVFKNVINPQVLDILKSQGKKFTPVSLELKKGTTVLTGANMGGKTVTLKTITLNLLLGMLGFFVFAEEASFPMLDFVHFVSEDLQSVSRGLSSFGAEVIKLKEILEDVKKGTGFIALDEIARGTNPQEGAHIVKAISRYLNGFSSITLLSTHYEGIVEEDMVHYQVVGLKNVNFGMLKQKINMNRGNSIEILQDHMDYSLEKVDSFCEVPKDALNICKILGLEEVVELAEKYYEKEE